MSSPPPKKLKSTDDGTAETFSWRAKCIEQFNLKPVPDGWKKSVAVGSDEAWRRYHAYRVKKEKDDPRNKSYDRYDSDGNSISGDEDGGEEGVSGIVFSWADYGMERLAKSMADGCEWQWTPQRPSVQWEDEGKPRSVNYNSHVWSPYAIPHAIKLNHEWYGKVRWEGYDLATDWNYMLLDFEDDVENSDANFVELCSNNYDVIKASHLNKATCAKLRKFLYGASTKKSKEMTCSDGDFWFLLLGSMGSTDSDLMEDDCGCSLGYSWCPWKDEAMKQRLFDEKAPADDDPNGEAPTSIEKYSPRWCSWLRYRVLEVTDSLGPVSKHYQPPPSKKMASVSRSYDDDDSEGYGYGYGSDCGDY